MEHLELTKQIKELYDSGSNIMEFMKGVSKLDRNSEDAILLSYEFQSGSYIENYKQNYDAIHRYAGQLAKYIQKYYPKEKNPSILEIGIGEATTFVNVVQQVTANFKNCYGLDISWSRLYCAQQFIKSQLSCDANLVMGTLFQTPFSDNAFDVVYTAHSLEPNGGRELEGLRELYRITKNYLCLFEPSYELANEEQRKRMEKHGYIQDLYKSAKELGYTILEHKLLEYSLNPMNPTSALIIRKRDTDDSSLSTTPRLECPISHTPIRKYDTVLYAKESYLMYPVIKEIACLLPDNAIPGYKFISE